MKVKSRSKMSHWPEIPRRYGVYLQFDIKPEARICTSFLLQTICFEDIYDILILFCFRVQMECM